MAKPELKMEVKSSLDTLGVVRTRIRKFIQTFKLPPDLVDNVELAVDEAVANAIEHAYPNQPNGIIQLRAWKEADRLMVAIRDFGQGYKPKRVSFADIKRVMKNRARGGMGRYLMQVCMDSVEYTSLPAQYNETLMTKRLD